MFEMIAFGAIDVSNVPLHEYMGSDPPLASATVSSQRFAEAISWVLSIAVL